MGFRFLHLADLHLETRFGGRPATRERLRRATIEAFEAAVDWALEHDVHAVLAAGDLYDDRILSPRTELALVRHVQRLAESGIWFLYACGNHDPGGPRFRAARLGLDAGSRERGDGPWRERVRIFRRPEPERVTVTDRSGRPVGVVVAAGHATDREASNLAARFERLEAGLPVVGLLHSHVANSRSAETHERYAPSVRGDYERLGYSYFALGHIHARQRALDGLPVFYAGNLQGRHARETGEKGGLAVEAQAGGFAEPEFVRFAPVRWERVSVDRLPEGDALAPLVRDLTRRVEALRSGASEEIAVRVELAGPTSLAPRLRAAAELEQIEEELALQCGALEVQLRADDVSLPVDRERLQESPTVIAEVLDLVERAARDELLLEALAPSELACDTGEAGAARLAYLRELLAELPEELLERALVGGAP